MMTAVATEMLMSHVALREKRRTRLPCPKVSVELLLTNQQAGVSTVAAYDPARAVAGFVVPRGSPAKDMAIIVANDRTVAVVESFGHIAEDSVVEIPSVLLFECQSVLLL